MLDMDMGPGLAGRADEFADGLEVGAGREVVGVAGVHAQGNAVLGCDRGVSEQVVRGGAGRVLGLHVQSDEPVAQVGPGVIEHGRQSSFRRGVVGLEASH